MQLYFYENNHIFVRFRKIEKRDYEREETYIQWLINKLIKLSYDLVKNFLYERIHTQYIVRPNES